MPRTRGFFFLIALLLSSLACQAVVSPFLPVTTPALSSHVNTLPSPLPPSLTPTAPPTATVSPLPPTPTTTPTIVPTPSPLQFQVFQELWQTVKDEYVYPDFNGLDWEAIYAEYEARISAGLTSQDFYAAMGEMIFRLGDDHSVFLSPEMVTEEDAEYAGENDYVGIGVITTLVPERQRVTIIAVFPGSPADWAGLQPHDNLLAVDGEAIVDENGYKRDLLRGPVDSSIELTVQTPGQPERQVRLTRQRVTGSVPVPYNLLLTPDGQRIGYILLTTFADENIDERVEDALRALSANQRLDGLILDNRQNSGGADNVARSVLSFFVSGHLGDFIDRNNHARAFRVIGTDILGSAKVPLVVLVGPGSVSFGEISAGVLQDTGRAFVIGEVTEGNIELLWGYEFEDGARAWIAHETFRPRRDKNENWEETGIIPDLIAPSNWDETTVETDPAIQKALEHFDSSGSN